MTKIYDIQIEFIDPVEKERKNNSENIPGLKVKTNQQYIVVDQSQYEDLLVGLYINFDERFSINPLSIYKKCVNRNCKIENNNLP